MYYKILWKAGSTLFWTRWWRTTGISTASAFKEYWGRAWADWLYCDNSYIASSASYVSALLVCMALHPHITRRHCSMFKVTPMSIWMLQKQQYSQPIGMIINDTCINTHDMWHSYGEWNVTWLWVMSMQTSIPQGYQYYIIYHCYFHQWHNFKKSNQHSPWATLAQ